MGVATEQAWKGWAENEFLFELKNILGEGETCKIYSSVKKVAASTIFPGMAFMPSPDRFLLDIEEWGGILGI